MRGFLIKPNKPTWRLGLPADTRSFSVFFQPILPHLAAFHWVFEECPFVCGETRDEEFERLLDAASAGYIAPNTLLPRYAHHVIDDWVDLCGFRQAPDVRTVRARLRRSRTDHEWLGRAADICLFNVDGAWWEVYAKEDAMLDAVASHARHFPDMTVQERQLAHRDALLRARSS